MKLPADRSHIITEHRHNRSQNLDALPVRDIVALMVDEHQHVTRAVALASDALTTFIEALVPRATGGGRFVYLGAGTSGRLGVLDASECPPTFQSDPEQVIGIIAGGDSALRRSSEGMEDDPNGAAAEFERLNVGKRDTVLGIAAGGTTPYVLGGICIAKQRRAMTGLLTCAELDSTVPNCDHLIVLPTGPELLTGSTRLKAGSATKLALNIITTTLFTQLGKVYSNLMVDIRATNQKLADRAIRILRELCPELTREDAAAKLAEADGSLKVAIVIQRLDVTREEAVRLLDEHDGGLRAILDEA